MYYFRDLKGIVIFHVILIPFCHKYCSAEAETVQVSFRRRKKNRILASVTSSHNVDISILLYYLNEVKNENKNRFGKYCLHFFFRTLGRNVRSK